MKKLYTIKPLEWGEFTHECGTVKYSAFTIGATYNIFYYDDGSIELDEYFARERNAQRLSCYSIEVAKQKANELWRRRVEKDLTEAIQTEVEATVISIWAKPILCGTSESEWDIRGCTCPDKQCPFHGDRVAQPKSSATATPTRS